MEKEEINIVADAQQIKEITEKFPGVDIEKILEPFFQIYNKYPFKDKYKRIWIDKIKESITLVNMNVMDREPVRVLSENEHQEYEKKEIKNEFMELTHGRNKSWSEATELLNKYVLSRLKLYTTKEDIKSEVWVYDEGVYVPQGKSEIKILLRDLLGEVYSSYIFGKVIDKIEPDTFIDSNVFFKSNYIYEIPVKNGILNIKTLELKEFDPNKIFFNKLPVSFDLSKQCPKIEDFLKQVLSNEEDIKVFFELAGFCLLGEYRFEKAFMMVGGGRNGKGKSLELLKRLVGMDNCTSIPLSSLSPESFTISELFGKRINLAGDIGNNDLKDTSTFKSLTGRDLIGGKRKFLPNIYFENYAKLVFACNELPMVYDLSKGFWDRWILLEYPFYFADRELYEKTIEKERYNWKIRDENIIEKISTSDEMSGFLNQAIIGLTRLFENGKFSSTKGSEEVKSTWIRKSNSFIAFCYDLIQEDYDGKINKKDLRKRYSKYCKEHKVVPKSDYVIKTVLQNTYGATDERKSSVGDSWEWFWTGIKFKNKINKR